MWVRRFMLAILLSLTSAPIWAQGFSWPEEPENIRALPESVKGRELGNVMRTFASALGVRCQYCHAAREGQELNPMDLTTFDFASDASPNKEKARTMIRMVRAINEDHLGELDRPEKGRISVSCFTCHHGVERPRRLEDILAETIASDGVEAAIAQYHELKETYYGAAAYNFRPGVLGWVGERLTDAENYDDAIAILTLENEQHPEFAWGLYLRATAHEKAGDRAAAVEHMQKAVDAASGNQRGFFERALESLK